MGNDVCGTNPAVPVLLSSRWAVKSPAVIKIPWQLLQVQKRSAQHRGQIPARDTSPSLLLRSPVLGSTAPLQRYSWGCSLSTSRARDPTGPAKPHFHQSMGSHCSPLQGSLTFPFPLQMHESSEPKRLLQMRSSRRSSLLWTGSPPMPTASSLRCFSPLKVWKESSVRLPARASSTMWKSKTETVEFHMQGLRVELS